MIGQIDGSRFVGLGGVFQLQFVVVGQPVEDRHRETTRETFVSVRTVIGEANRRPRYAHEPVPPATPRGSNPSTRYAGYWADR